MNREQWRALALRCEAAKGPDDDLERAIMAALGYTVRRCGDDGQNEWFRPSDHAYAGPITNCFHAITALIDREGWKRWHLDFCGGSVVPAVARVVDSKATGAHSATPALALCAAFCRAMAERAQDGER